MDIWIKEAAKRAAAKLTLTASLGGCAGSHKLVEFVDASGDASNSIDASSETSTADARVQVVDAGAPVADAGMCMTPSDRDSPGTPDGVACCVATLEAAYGRGTDTREPRGWGRSEGFRSQYGVRFASAEDRASSAVSACCGWLLGNYQNQLGTALNVDNTPHDFRSPCCEVTSDGPIGCTPWGPACPVAFDGASTPLFA